MEKELYSLDISALQSLLSEEIAKQNSLKLRVSELEAEVQRIEQKNEKQEERLMGIFGKKIAQLKEENSQTSLVLQNEEHELEVKTSEKYQKVVDEKNKLLNKISFHEKHVIVNLQNEIQDLTEKIESLNLNRVKRDQAEKLLEDLEKIVEQKQINYEADLESLSEEIDNLIEENSKVLQEISKKQNEAPLVHSNSQFDSHNTLRTRRQSEIVSFCKKKRRKSSYSYSSSINL